MVRSRLAICLVFCIVCAFPPAQAQDLPIIVGYELKKASQEARVIARNPKAFWARQIVARIENKTQDLREPLKAAVIVRVSFVVGRDGHLLSKAISQSSGNLEADRTAMAMLDGAQPFPPMPKAMPDAQMSFTLPVRFR